jgi:hypothetical protein
MAFWAAGSLARDPGAVSGSGNGIPRQAQTAVSEPPLGRISPISRSYNELNNLRGIASVTVQNAAEEPKIPVLNQAGGHSPLDADLEINAHLEIDPHPPALTRTSSLRLPVPMARRYSRPTLKTRHPVPTVYSGTVAPTRPRGRNVPP